MQAMANPPAPPPAPAAAPAPPPADSNGSWVRWTPRNYNGNALKISDVVGTIIIAVRDGGPMTVEASGDKRRMKNLQVTNDDGELQIEAGNDNDDHSVWDVGQWSQLLRRRPGMDRSNMFVKVTIPRGMRVNIDGPRRRRQYRRHLWRTAFRSRRDKGPDRPRWRHACRSGWRRYRVNIAAVDGDLHLDVGGSGKVNTGPIGGLVEASIAGSGDASFGAIGGAHAHGYRGLGRCFRRAR